MTRAEEKSIAYQLATHGPRVMGGANILSEDEYMRLNMNYDFKAGYEQAEKDLGWISVKDRLPEENKWVFVCVDMQGVPQCVGLGYLKDGEWCDDENDNGFCVDYWMEIPKLPEEEEQ